MLMKYNMDIDTKAVLENLNRLTDQIYKLLPSREEGVDWETPLETIIEELAGMSELFRREHKVFFRLLCKLEGLFELIDADDFNLYRRVIFESLSLLERLKTTCRDSMT